MNQIKPDTMKMIQREAAEVFRTAVPWSYLRENERKALDTAIAHAFEHALEEGIVVLPEIQREQIAQLMADKAILLTQVKALKESERLLDQVENLITKDQADELRDIRRSTEIGMVHDGIALEMQIQKFASALAIAEGFNPNDIPTDTWDFARVSYERKAKKMIELLDSMNDE